MSRKNPEKPIQQGKPWATLRVFYYTEELMQFFKHYGTMRHDPKIAKLIKRYGIRGYGLYNLILECITESLSSDKPLPELELSSADIAELYNDDTVQINEAMAYMINNELFELNEINGRILCKKIYKILDKSSTRSIEIKKMINNFKMLTMSVTSADNSGQVPPDIEVDKDIEVEIDKEYILNQFEVFWNLYDKKVGRSKCILKWNKIKPELYNAIFLHVKKYIIATPNKQYRLNPETYLNGQRWNDEIIIHKNEKQPTFRQRSNFLESLPDNMKPHFSNNSKVITDGRDR